MSARGAVSTKRRCECGDPAPYSTPRKQADLLAALKGSATRAGGACPVSGSSKTFLLPNRHTIQRPDLASLEVNMKLRLLRAVFFATALLTALAASLHAQNLDR